MFMGGRMKYSLLGEVKGIYNKLTLMEMLISFIWIFIGILLVSNESLSNLAFSIILGVLCIISGLSSIYMFIKRGSILLYNFNIFYGIIMILIGLLSMLVGKSLQIFLGIYIIFLAIQKITYAIFLQRFGELSWLLTLIVGILYLAMGILSMFSEKVIVVCGIVLIGYGLINLVNVLLLRKRSKYYIA